MAVGADGSVIPNPLISFGESQGGRNLLLMLGAAIVLAVMAGVWMWSQQPEYRVLFSNFSDRDGGAIVTQLQQMNVPYKFAEGGGAIMVPAEQVHDTRLRIAAMGLPKGGNVGFELMENQKLGVSQFLEQVNFQRALEGELARSIQSIGVVESARVHLAMPKASVFVRDQQKPTASVVLNLQTGRPLSEQQVSAIVHLVASSVPELPPGNISVIDQNGNLLSDTSKAAKANGLDPTQLKYVQEIQQNIVRRIESIITPIVGPNNVRAEATADIDFSTSEQAAETYKPNSPPNQSTMRSQQTSESQGSNPGAGGVPGALSNQPSANATAPINPAAPAVPVTPGATTVATPGAGATATTTTPSQKELTVNYEVDKTVRYVQQPMGGVKRISVAVVVNFKQVVDKTGNVVATALTEAERLQITDLAKEAMGFNKDRGDTLNVVNTAFAGVPKEIFPEVPIWKKPEMIQLAKEFGKYAVGGIVLLYLFFGVLRPMLKKFNTPAKKINTVVDDESDESETPEMNAALNAEQADEVAPEPAGQSYQQNLDLAKQLAKDDPKVVANIVKNWVSGNE
ncbi:flagellar basal-body MS-ring/collar protein FliF [Actimicrobium sp. CCI2.3]|uniref:flagellar basal-body MS-ring/collar protein FliF n=1 Tax=Actimicrobium sp. CCI2.3 TaxID=3048616 RepID=UPI002AB4C77C|nr:flagellar basal-body MS-ring/collar protein FliF [Actimicrobium sp. CCI2.3]MDY7575000.1 flagellar basal-body MS-ring/collar protein FliF [Actimicrobium sp. CCI2.3]MEB0021429.1 flagellar basal-body MS-ring/collar protein FliF [Actimicrobium sp. CCI2.3]